MIDRRSTDNVALWMNQRPMPRFATFECGILIYPFGPRTIPGHDVYLRPLAMHQGIGGFGGDIENLARRLGACHREFLGIDETQLR